jgi:hypothetical protein
MRSSRMVRHFFHILVAKQRWSRLIRQYASIPYELARPHAVRA